NAAKEEGERVDELVEVVVELEVDLVIRVMVVSMVKGDVRNVIANNDHKGCTYKEFLACNHKEYDRKGGAVVYTRWIEKMDSVKDISGCEDNQKVKYTAGSFFGKALTWWNSQIHTLGREVAIGMSWDNFKVLIREEFYPSNEIKKLETELWSHTMVGTVHAAYTDRFHELDRGEPSKDRNERDDNKRTRTENAFATTTNIVKREYIGSEARGNHQNQVMAINGGQGHRNNGNQARGRAFMLGVEEAYQDLNIMTGIEPSNVGFSYEIEIASGQLVEIDKVTKGCTLEIEGHAEIICHEKVVRIPLPDGKVLRVIGERPEEKMRHLRSSKNKEQKKEEIVRVRDYPKVFLDDLSGLPPNREIECRIELVLGAIPVVKSPYRLASSEMEELSGQLKEL
nr:reverse transcriptase domain-containing protein [Tanacetum cinerariifolium]